MEKRIFEAYRLIGEKTPLRTDCGALCGARCCGADGDGQGGVWLYPGEEEIVRDEDWCGVEARCEGTLMTCMTMCDRDKRPFGCRIFPLAPVERENGTWTVRIDARAKAICPIAGRGLKGLDQEFVRSCAAAVKLLSEDAEYAAVMRARLAEEEEYRRDTKAIRNVFSSGKTEY